MSRKNRSRSANKQKMKRNNRKIKRKLKRLEQAGKTPNVVSGNLKQFVVNMLQNEKNPQTAENPTTSHRCKKQLSPKISPWKKCGGKVNRFKKIVDDQARRIVRRSVHFINEKQCTIGKPTPKKTPPQTKTCKRKINQRGKDFRKWKKKNVSSTLEDGEIRTDMDESSTSSSSTVKEQNTEEDEEDCIVVEPTLEEITIDDNDEDDFPSTSVIATNYQSIVHTFKDCISSTPCGKDKSPENEQNMDETKNDVLPFFVDVGRGTESINSTDNFADYIKLSTLREINVPKRRSLRLKDLSNNSEIINLDDTSNDNADVTLKRKSGEMDDDSVIFISETNKNDFIPIVDDNIPPHKILKISEPSPSTPVNKLRTDNLFTRSETKKLNEYNENAYNPSASEELKSGKRMVILDGSNVAFKHGLDQVFSVKGLKIAIEYFEKMGHEVKAVLPQFRMNKTKSSDPDELVKLHKAGKIVQTPCKNLPGHSSTSYDDRFILQLAFATDAAIVSNDNYRDLLHENPAFKKIIENRVIGYTWCNDIFILPKDPYGKWGPTLETILNRK